MGTEWQDEVPYPGPSHEPSIFDFIADIGKVYSGAINNFILTWNRGFGKTKFMLDIESSIADLSKALGITTAEASKMVQQALRLGIPLEVFKFATPPRAQACKSDQGRYLSNRHNPPRHVGPRPRRQYDKNGRRRY